MGYYFTCSLTCRVARANLFARGELTKALCLRPLANKFASATQKLFGQQARKGGDKNECFIHRFVLLTRASRFASRPAQPRKVAFKSEKTKSSEMFYIDNEIARLLPKSDKTGKNIALGATGIIFIIPLFFMDLKQGEKKEIEAYRQR